MTLRPSDDSAVYQDEGVPQAAAGNEIGAGHEERADGRGNATRRREEAGAGPHLLHGRGEDVVLRALGESGVLRNRGAADVVMRVPLRAEEGSAPSVDPSATEAAWMEFHVRLRRFVARRVRQAADAEDIVQRVFLQMHRTLPSMRDTERIRAWLYRASRNAIADYFRGAGSRREIVSGDTRELDRRDDSGRDAEQRRAVEIACAAECLRSMTRKLPPLYRAAIEHVEFDGLSQSAAAVAEGLSVSGMKARVQRGRRRLKSLLLDHCRVALDRRGGVVACEGRRPCRTNVETGDAEFGVGTRASCVLLASSPSPTDEGASQRRDLG